MPSGSPDEGALAGTQDKTGGDPADRGTNQDDKAGVDAKKPAGGMGMMGGEGMGMMAESKAAGVDAMGGDKAELMDQQMMKMMEMMQMMMEVKMKMMSGMPDMIGTQPPGVKGMEMGMKGMEMGMGMKAREMMGGTMYFFKMRSAAALFGRIEASKGAPPPGSAPELAGTAPPPATLTPAAEPTEASA